MATPNDSHLSHTDKVATSHRGPFWRVVALLAILVIAVSFFFGEFLLNGILVTIGIRRPTIPVAIYDNITFTQINEMSKMRVGLGVGESKDKCVNLYVRIADGPPIHLPQLSHSDIDRIYLLSYTDETDEGKESVYSRGYTTFKFREQLFVYAVIYDSSDIQFALHKDGPYYRLPISRETMYELFGKPKRWGRESVMGF